MKILTMRLQGSMQAWGNSEFNVRATEDFPTHSGIMGIIGSAMGYSREQSEFLSLVKPLQTAFRIDLKGSKMRDFQVVSYSKPKQTRKSKLVEKMYLSDASFLCAVYDPTNQSDELLQNIKDALLKPSNMLFLGRKSCPPSVQIFEELGDYEDIIEAFETIKAPECLYIASDPTIHLEAWLPGNRGKSPRLTKDIPLSFSSKNKEFTSRIISRFNIELQNPDYEYEQQIEELEPSNFIDSIAKENNVHQ